MVASSVCVLVFAAMPLVSQCRDAVASSAIVSGIDVTVRPRAFTCAAPNLVRVNTVILSVGELVNVPSPPPLSPPPVPAADSIGILLSGPCARSAVTTVPSIRLPNHANGAFPKSMPVHLGRNPNLSDGAVENLKNRMIYDALCDGTVNVRSREWRSSLLSMLTNGTPGTDFDRVFSFLFNGFAGNDERARIAALDRWVAANATPKEQGDVFRGETRYWLNVGDAAMTADAAGRMERARPDYAVRACRLRALGYAVAGEAELSRREIARARQNRDLPKWERQELLYLEAWLWLQEGSVASAVRNLRTIVSDSPSRSLERKAKSVLESIEAADAANKEG